MLRRLRWLFVCLLMLGAGTCALANDAADFLQSPGSEAANFTLDVGADVFDFFRDVLEIPDAMDVGVIHGDTTAWYIGIDKDWTVGTGLERLPEISGAAMVGVTVDVADPETPKLQPVAGLAIGLTNIRGGTLLLGANLCASELSDDVIDLGPLGRYHYAPKVEYRFPLAE